MAGLALDLDPVHQELLLEVLGLDDVVVGRLQAVDGELQRGLLLLLKRPSTGEKHAPNLGLAQTVATGSAGRGRVPARG